MIRPFSVATIDQSGLGLLHFANFYLLTLLAGICLPRLRRLEVAGAVAVLTALYDGVWASLGRPCLEAGPIYDLAGVVLCGLPGLVERLRHDARSNPYLPFSEIHRSRRRRRKALLESGELRGA